MNFSISETFFLPLLLLSIFSVEFIYCLEKGYHIIYSLSILNDSRFFSFKYFRWAFCCYSSESIFEKKLRWLSVIYQFYISKFPLQPPFAHSSLLSIFPSLIVPQTLQLSILYLRLVFAFGFLCCRSVYYWYLLLIYEFSFWFCYFICLGYYPFDIFF